MSKQITSSTVAAAIVFVAASLVLVGTTRADVIAKTTLSLDSTITLSDPSLTVDSVVFDWSTAQMTGQIITDDLINLTFSLLQGTTTVYTDVAIINSVVQPIGGVARDLSDIIFDFDLDNLPSGLTDFDNDVAQKQDSGTTFNIYDDGFDTDTVVIDRYIDGGFDDDGESQYTQTTLAVPEPSGFLCIGLAGLGFGFVRRKKLNPHPHAS